ncbi:hypothetical protein MTQ04_12020 [Micrococcus sp. XM4230A]|uniref:hypothetical protein n=1 Tax=Micrococcus sp. XM4230A TaxID=2929774 RepID=UPI001FF90D4F|nr:hypothetical protein [Micrococcus sp. XM4230A]MCK1812660.1 hypothetical protein [Micrococcus sp. XM4230A]
MTASVKGTVLATGEGYTTIRDSTALPAQFVSLQAALEAVLDPGEDSVLVCDLGLTATLGAEQFSFLGRSREISVDGPIII